MCDYGISESLIASAVVSAGGSATASAAAISAAAVAATVASDLAIAGAGTAASMYGMQQSQAAANKVAQAANDQNAALGDAEQTRQNALNDQKRGIFNETLGQVGQSEQAKENKDAAALTKTYSQPAADAANSMIPGLTSSDTGQSGTGAPKVISDTYRKDLGNVSDFLKGQAKARGGMDAFTAGNIGIRQKIADDTSNIGLFNSFGQQSNDVLGVERGAVNSGAQIGFNDAQYKGDNAETLGSLLTTAGTALGSYQLARGTGGTTVKPTGSVKTAGALDRAQGSVLRGPTAAPLIGGSSLS